MTKPQIGSVQDIIEERDRWVKYEQGQARLSVIGAFCMGIVAGVLITCFIFYFFR